MKIHGIVYLIVGAFVIGFSYYITSINDKIDLQKFALFLWVGYVFLAVGAFKLVANFILNRPEKPKENRQQLQQPVQQMQQQQAYTGKICSRCGSSVRQFDMFCYKCGSREFRR